MIICKNLKGGLLPMTTPHDFAQQLRQQQAAKRPGPTPQDGASEQVTTLTIPTSVGAVPVYRHQPHFVPAQRVIINLHGSGFIFPYNAYDDLFAKQLCLSTQALVLDVDYPLGPRTSFSPALTGHVPGHPSSTGSVPFPGRTHDYRTQCWREPGYWDATPGSAAQSA